MNWHQKSVDETLSELKVAIIGLSEHEAHQRPRRQDRLRRPQCDGPERGSRGGQRLHQGIRRHFRSRARDF